MKSAFLFLPISFFLFSCATAPVKTEFNNTRQYSLSKDAASSRKHHPLASKDNYELTFKLDQSSGADQYALYKKYLNLTGLLNRITPNSARVTSVTQA